MKRKSLFILTGVMAAVLFTGCEKKGAYSDYAKYVTLSDYKGIEVERVIYTVTQDDLDAEIENLLYSYSETTEITDRPAQEGDIVTIDYVGTIDGEEFDGGSEEDCEVELGTDSFIDGFEDALIGMELGETKTFTVTFPEPYDGELDGKDAEFTVTMNEIYQLEMPEMTDAFVKENTEYLTVSELEQGYLQELQESYDDDSNSTAAYDALYQIMEDSTIDGYPDNLYNETKDEMNAFNEQIAEMFGMSVEDLYGEDYDEDMAILEYVNEKLTVYAIADAEGLEVTDEEYDSYVEDIIAYYGYDSVEEYEEDYSAESTKYEILYEKVMDVLIENCTFIDVDEEDYYDDEYYDDDEYYEDDEYYDDDEYSEDDEYFDEEEFDEEDISDEEEGDVSEWDDTLLLDPEDDTESLDTE